MPSTAQTPRVRSTDHLATKMSRLAMPVIATAEMETLARTGIWACIGPSCQFWLRVNRVWAAK
jgi:hypothetical protein